MPNVTARVRNADLQALLRKLKPEQLLEPITKLLQGGTKLAEQAAKDRAPYRTGEALGAISSTVSAGTEPIGRITETALSGIMTNYGGWHKTSKYGPSSSARTGKSGRTRGWFTGVVRLKAVKQGVDALMEKARQEIEARWRL